MRIIIFVIIFLTGVSLSVEAQSESCIVIRPERIFDGEKWHNDEVVWVQGDKIKYVGTEQGIEIPEGCKILNFPEGTLMPGMIEGHSHMLLHPYNETSWNDQVLKESYAERAIRGAIHAERTLAAGFTMARDLGSEGAGYVDVGLKQSIEKGIIKGPRLLVAGKAIVATGSYGPKGFGEHVHVPLGAEVADGHDNLIKVVRDQIGHGADVIKVYADYRWGPGGTARATFTTEELRTIVEVASSSGRQTVAHASSEEGMRRAIQAGVATIEHGDSGTPEIFTLMRQKGVALCPTLAAGDAITQYRGWKKGVEEEPQRIKDKRKSFSQALAAGVTIVAGGDVGVFPHGENVVELEMMVDYGMPIQDVLTSVTSGNARVFGLEDQLGQIRSGMLADMIVIQGDPRENISLLRQPKFVMIGGSIYKYDIP